MSENEPEGAGHDPRSDDGPRRGSAGPESAAHRRTRERMRTLLVAAGALGLGACGEHDDHPPIVGDPIPQPLRCETDRDNSILSQRVYTYGKWIQVSPSPIARLWTRISSYRGDDPLTFARDPDVTGATVLRLDRQATDVELDLAPPAGQGAAEVLLPLSCNGLAASRRYRADLGKPKMDALIPVTDL